MVVVVMMMWCGGRCGVMASLVCDDGSGDGGCVVYLCGTWVIM